jgi:hypothetical protein
MTEDPLAVEVAKYYDDPLGFVLDCFPWGEGELAGEDGPDENQREFLISLGNEVKTRNFVAPITVMPILMAITSGHGTGKSALGAWIVWWILSTRPGSDGTVTAGTFTQLESRTWAAIQWWGKLCITVHWFEIQSAGIYSKTDPEGWKVTAQTCKEENAQSFAGQHARRSTSWYLFDEASEVPTKIWDTAMGGTTDGEPMFFAWGQMVRNTGRFYEVCFGSRAERWNHRRVDSNTSKLTNKVLIAQWKLDYGEDSDYYRVRVLGLPPQASELQFIDRTRIQDAQVRIVFPLDDDPLVAGFDVSGGGSAWNVIRFRRGVDGRSLAPIRISGERGRDRAVLIGVCAELLADQRPERKIAAMFVDSAFGSPIVERLRSMGFDNVHEVTFGGPSPDVHQANWRAYMWFRLKEWLLRGMIPGDLGDAEPNGNRSLAMQLGAPGFHLNQSSKLVLESKADMQKRGEASPDDADAMALTFAQHVAPVAAPEHGRRYEQFSNQGSDGWMA